MWHKDEFLVCTVYLNIQDKFLSYQLSSAVNSCQQLITVNENENQPRELKFGKSINFSVYINIPVIFFFILAFLSCQQQSSRFDSCWQLIWKNFNWNFLVQTKVYTCAEFQLSRLISIFISCQQLLSVVDSWRQLSQKKINGITIYHLKLIPLPNFGYVGWGLG